MCICACADEIISRWRDAASIVMHWEQNHNAIGMLTDGQFQQSASEAQCDDRQVIGKSILKKRNM